MKRPFITSNGAPISQLNLSQAAQSIIDEATTSTAADTLVIDTLGLSSEQLETLQGLVKQGIEKSNGLTVKDIQYLR